jgi:glycosyltransferase involved in cell wall biosynthesis
MHGIAGMKIAYLINRYPAVSHSFIRREILALEAAGAVVDRFSIRPFDTNLPDPADRAEADRTQVVVSQGIAALFVATLKVAIGSPARFFTALRIALRAFANEPRRGWRQIFYLVEACWIARNLRGVAHLHAHFGTNPAAVARLIGALTGIPYSFTVHGPDEFDAPGALDIAGKIADARHVMAISSYGRSQLMRWSDPGHWSKIAVVPCGVDRVFTEANAPRADYGKTLCCVARLSAQKGIPLLIEAVTILAARRSDFRLVLVGDGEMRAEIEHMIVDNGLSDIVSITGFVGASRVRDILLSSRAMVLPSFAEGLPVVIMEALALETPVIVTAIAGVPELVSDACGWVIPAGSVPALVQAMDDALDCDTATLAAKGRAGRARVLERHESGKIGADLALLLQDAA